MLRLKVVRSLWGKNLRKLQLICRRNLADFLHAEEGRVNLQRFGIALHKVNIPKIQRSCPFIRKI